MEERQMRDIDTVVRKFRETGLKITPQRLSIFKLLQDNYTHPSAEDIYREILKTHPSISFTTVYKTLQTLRDLGEIKELCINPERAHFDAATNEHAHTFCRSCKTIGDLDNVLGNPGEMKLPDGPDGFEVHSIQIHAIGLCEGCR